jgi:hypothetical protein
MELVGQDPNPDLRVRFGELKRDLATLEPAVASTMSCPGRPLGDVLRAVVAVLDDGRTRRMIEIHDAVEQRLGEPVPRSSVKNALANHTSKGQELFVRVAHGRYRVATDFDRSAESEALS